MGMKKRTIVFTMAAMLTVLLLSGCGGDKNPPEIDQMNQTESGQEADSEAPKADETEEEKNTRLETTLAKMDSIAKADITKVKSEYHVKITLAEGKYNMDNELKDAIITEVLEANKGLEEKQIVIEVQEREEN